MDPTYPEPSAEAKLWMLQSLAAYIKEGGGSFRCLIDHLDLDYYSAYTAGGMDVNNALDCEGEIALPPPQYGEPIAVTVVAVQERPVPDFGDVEPSEPAIRLPKRETVTNAMQDAGTRCINSDIYSVESYIAALADAALAEVRRANPTATFVEDA